MRLLLQVLVGLLYLVALVLVLEEKRGAELSIWLIFAALLSFTTVNLLNFYLEQFDALAAFFFNLAVFFVLLMYRTWYLTPRTTSE